MDTGCRQHGTVVGRVVLFDMMTALYTAAITFAILKVVEKRVGLRVSREDEIGGLDIALREERGYDL